MRVLSDDFIDEAQVRFARSTTKELARYIENAVLTVVKAEQRQYVQLRPGCYWPIPETQTTVTRASCS